MGGEIDTYSETSARAAWQGPGGRCETSWACVRSVAEVGASTAQERVTGGPWRRVVLGDLVAEQVVQLRGRPRLWPRVSAGGHARRASPRVPN